MLTAMFGLTVTLVPAVVCPIREAFPAVVCPVREAWLSGDLCSIGEACPSGAWAQ